MRSQDTLDCLHTCLPVLSHLSEIRCHPSPIIVWLLHPWVQVTKGQVTRSGQVTPPPQKLYNRVTVTVVERKIWNFQDLVYYQVPTTCTSRIFYNRWPKVRSISWPPHYKSMGKTQILIRSVQIAQNHAQLGYCWWPRCKIAYVTPGKIIWGQIMTSWGQCTFLLITFDWNEIETWGRF